MGLFDKLIKGPADPAPETLAQMMAKQGIAGAGAAAMPAPWKGPTNPDPTRMSGRVPLSPPQEQATAAGIYDNSKAEVYDRILGGKDKDWGLEKIDRALANRPSRSEAYANDCLAETAQRSSSGSTPRATSTGAFTQRGMDR